MWIEVNLTEKELEDLDIFYKTLILTEPDKKRTKALKKIVGAYRHHTKSQRNADILKMRDEEHTFDDIAHVYNISKERARQICVREERRRKSIVEVNNTLFDDRPVFYACLLKAAPDVGVNNSQAIRAYNCLHRAGIIQEMIETNTTLDKYNDQYLMNIRNFGTLSLILCRKANEFYKEMIESESDN